MRNAIFKLAALGIAAQFVALAVPAFAQDAASDTATKAFTISGGAAVVSDYRFRGVTLDNKDFAFQPTLTVTHSSGLYAGVWASNIAPNPGDDIEVDLYGGFAGGDAVTYDIGATYYVYPGFGSINYIEFTGKLGTTVGPAKLGAQVSYAPKQGTALAKDNLYTGLNAAVGVPNTPLTLTGSVGRENGAFGAKKIDWSLGANVVYKGFTLGAQYIDTNRNTTFAAGDGKAGAVFTLSYGF